MAVYKEAYCPMRRTLSVIALLLGCGKDDPATPDAPKQPDGTVSNCQPIAAVGAFYRRTTNPRLIAGTHTYSDNKVDIGITDPDVHWDEAAQSWVVFFHGPHATDFSSPITGMIRRVTTPDFVTWTYDDTPALVGSSTMTDWDVGVETPSVVYNPNAPADRKYILYYSGSNGGFGFNYGFPNYQIGAAISADGKTFTRLPAGESLDGKPGLVLRGSDAYPGTTAALVADPDVAFVDGVYHMWFSSFSCIGNMCETVSAYGVSYATSTDGIHWQVNQAPTRTLLRATSDNKTGGAQPSVVYDAIHCRWEMWLVSDVPGEVNSQPVMFNNMAGVWHALSNDGLSWDVSFTSTRDLVWKSTEAGEHLGLLTGVDVAGKLNGRYMLYSGFDDQNVPNGFVLPSRPSGFQPGVMTLNLATRDAP